MGHSPQLYPPVGRVPSLCLPPKGWNLWRGVSQRVPTLLHSPLGRAMTSTDIFVLMDFEKNFSSRKKRKEHTAVAL